MNHLEQTRLHAARLLDHLVNLPDQAHGSDAQTRKALAVVDAIADHVLQRQIETQPKPPAKPCASS